MNTTLWIIFGGLAAMCIPFVVTLAVIGWLFLCALYEWVTLK